MTSSQSKQVRVQLANIEPGLTVHCIDSHVVVLCLFSHTGHIAYYTVLCIYSYVVANCYTLFTLAGCVAERQNVGLWPANFPFPAQDL